MQAGMSPEVYLNAGFILCHMGIIWDVVVNHHLCEHMAACIAVVSVVSFARLTVHRVWQLAVAPQACVTTAFAHKRGQEFGEAEACCVSQEVQTISQSLQEPAP